MVRDREVAGSREFRDHGYARTEYARRSARIRLRMSATQSYLHMMDVTGVTGMTGAMGGTGAHVGDPVVSMGDVQPLGPSSSIPSDQRQSPAGAGWSLFSMGHGQRSCTHTAACGRCEIS
jgi:hypothetical protein